MTARESGVDLVDAHRVLSLFAEGIAGRAFHLKSLEGLRPPFRSDSPLAPTSEGFFVYLPDRIDAFPDPRANLGQYRAALMHQLAFFEFGTYAFDLGTAREKIPALAGREPPEGRLYRSEFERFFNCFDAPSQVRRVFALFEDDRVDRRLARVYPGLRGDLERAMALALETRGDLATIDSGAALLEALVRYTLGADAEALCARDATGLLRPLLEELEHVRAPEADVYTSAAAAVSCVDLFGDGAADGFDAEGAEAVGPETLTLPTSEIEADEAGFRGRPGFELAQLRLRVQAAEALLETLSEARGAIPAEVLERLAEEAGLELEGFAGKAAGGGISATGDAASTRAVASELTRRIRSDEIQLQSVFGEMSRTDRSFLYDEWDFHRGAYLRGWCRLYEHPLQGQEGAAFLESVRERHATLLSQVRRRFQNVQPESLQRVGRVLDGEDVDLDSAVEAHVDLRAGRVPGDRVYVRRERARREVAAAFLVDLSGSVSQPVPDPDATPPPVPDEDDDYLWGTADAPPREPERRVLDVEKEALALMVQALETLGDAYAIYGFSGSGRENVEFYVAKEFERSLGLPVWNAIAAMRPQGSTRMGPALRHTIRKLERQDASRKVLLLVSDGFPQDQDYGPDRGDHEYGIRDTAQALREAERAGIQTFCVTVDAAGNDYLRRMCPDQQYLVIDDVELLPSELGKVYRTLTRRA